MASLASGASVVFGAKVPPTARPVAPRRLRGVVAVRADGNDEAQGANRRAALGALAGATTLLLSRPSYAAYGEAANIFGKPTNTSGYIPYRGEGFALLVPSTWNPSKERDFKDTVFRYEDNYDPFSHVVVTRSKVDKSSIEQVASVDKFLKESITIWGNRRGEVSDCQKEA